MAQRLHELKIWPEFFQAVKKGEKTFDIRLNDRHYSVGDMLSLREWNPGTKQYTGFSALRKVCYILDNPDFGLKEGYVVLGLKKVKVINE